MAANSPEWSRAKLMKWMFQAVGQPDGGPEPLRLKQGFSLALALLEEEMPACIGLSMAFAAAYDSEVLQCQKVKGNRRLRRRRTHPIAYPVFVALSYGCDEQNDVVAMIAVASVIHSYLAKVSLNRRLLYRIQEQLGIEVGEPVARHVQPARWTACEQARKLSTVIGQLRHASRSNDRGAACLGLANGPEREESARLAVELLSSFR